MLEEFLKCDLRNKNLPKSIRIIGEVRRDAMSDPRSGDINSLRSLAIKITRKNIDLRIYVANGVETHQ
jgi:hypothetical protein